MQIGARYYGSPSIQTSEANQELVPERVGFYKFSIMNDNDCSVRINGSDPIFLRAGQGFSTEAVDAFINSFIIAEEGVQFNWIGGIK